MTETKTFDGIDYAGTERVFAPCYGANHNHDRRIGKCPSCGDAVVLYGGRVLDVRNSSGYYAARKFTCWAPSHQCPPMVSEQDQARYTELRWALGYAQTTQKAAEEAGDTLTHEAIGEGMKVMRVEFKALAERTGLEYEW